MENLSVPEILKIIREQRKEQGLNQHEMAAKLAMSQGAYANLENGVSEIKLAQFFEIIKILGISDIFKSEENPTPPEIETVNDLAKVLKVELSSIQEKLDQILKK